MPGEREGTQRMFPGPEWEEKLSELAREFVSIPEPTEQQVREYSDRAHATIRQHQMTFDRDSKS